ncbi:MAG TPA: hypothetical protein VL200_10310 [Lacunisphaera sp.]|jgi:hypothetical protein|nr:hypothetical protein [Lacunisphaera sp.]
MKTTSLLIPLLALLVSGCTSALSPERATQVDRGHKGFVLATWEHGTPLYRGGAVHAEVPLQPANRPRARLFDPGISNQQPLSLLALPPGRYRISEWYMWGAVDNAAVPRQRYEFVVRPGEITYLGNFDLVTDNAAPGIIVRGATVLVLDDHYEKAVTDFARQFPALASLPVRNGAPAREFALMSVPAEDSRVDSFTAYVTVNPWGISLPQNNPLWP